MINKYEKVFNNDKEDSNFWPSFTDLLSTLLLCFILFFIIMMFRNAFEINGLKDTIEQILGVRVEIVQDLQKEFAESELDIEIDKDTGAIVFNTDILFGFNETELKEESKKYLDEFMPTYLKVILDKKYEEYIAEIIIEGHTDKNGPYLYNLELSQARATSVAGYILSEEYPHKDIQEELRDKLTVNGKSFTDEVLDQNNQYDDQASRRVEIKFRLKDEEIMKEMMEMLE